MAEAFLLIISIIPGYENDLTWIKMDSMKQCEESLAFTKHKTINNTQEIFSSIITCAPRLPEEE